VVRITGDFQQERVLHPAAIALLPQFFTTGWADPAKLNNSSRQVNIMLEQVRQSFAKALNVRSDEIEFLGEPDLGFQLGIAGLLNTESKLFYSSIDRQKVFAITANEKNSGRTVIELPVNNDGMIQESGTGSDDLLVWQVANGETGNIQYPPKGGANIFADCTSSGVDLLPNFNYQTALFDSRSWAGPSGVGILVIKSSATWRNPLPHNDLNRTPNTYSLPLLLASAVALENYLTQTDIRSKLKKEIIDFIKEQITDVDIASSDNGLGKFISLSIKGVEADRLLLDLEDQGFAVESGSACKSADMKPSHVLAAMGRPITGNIRLTIHKEMTSEIVKDFCQVLKSSVIKLRSN
jgi:cysteine desulfurase